MIRLIALPRTRRMRGNPNWGKPFQPLPDLPTEFEMQVERLGLTREQYVSSAQLEHWCERNRNRVYVPEWLLEAWGLTVDGFFIGFA